MSYKRILTVQDISCVGQCSMTVALPVLSACGVETCALPTAVLSTHTGGFRNPVVQHLPRLKETLQHWQREGIRFDAIYSGYLGSSAAVDGVLELADTLLDGELIVDPAMADHGKLYSGFDENYISAMSRLCARADILLPNLTEAAMLAGVPYVPSRDPDYARSLGEQLPQKHLIITGVGEAGQTGALIRTEGTWVQVHQQLEPGSYSGTGDLFASCFTGAYVQGWSVSEAAALAAELTTHCIRNTRANPAHSYGIKFETILPELIARLNG